MTTQPVPTEAEIIPDTRGRPASDDEYEYGDISQFDEGINVFLEIVI